MRSVTVGMTGPQGVSEGHQEEGEFCYSLLGGGGWWSCGGSSEDPPLPQGWCLISPEMGRLGLLAAFLGRLSGTDAHQVLGLGSQQVIIFFPASPWMGQFDLKGESSPKPQLGGGKRRWGFLPPHPGRSGYNEGAIRVSKTLTETHVLMETGVRVLGPQGFQPVPRRVPWLVWQHQPPCVVMWGGLWLPWGCRRAPRVGETRASLILEFRGLHHPGPRGPGLAVPITAVQHGTGRLSGTDARDNRGPTHFLWTWTLAYSE